MRVRIAAGASIALALVFGNALPAIANSTTAVLVTPARVELAVPDARPVTTTVTVLNPTAGDETVRLSLVDFLVHEQAYQLLPAGATPYSIAASLQLSSTVLTLAPKARAEVKLTYTPAGPAALRAGAMLVTPDRQGIAAGGAGSSGGGGVMITQQAAIPVIAVPTGSDGQLDSSMTLTAASVSMDLQNTLGWPALSFQETGPISVRATFRNTGNAIGRFDTWFTYSNLGRAFLTSEAPPGVALPGTTATATGSTMLTLPGQASAVDVAPMFGIIRVHASSSLILLSQRSPETSQDRYVVIAPWRALGVALAILAGVWWAMSHRRRTA